MKLSKEEAMSSFIALLLILVIIAIPVGAIVWFVSASEWGKQGLGALNQSFDDFTRDMRRGDRERSSKN